MNIIEVSDKKFEPYISQETIETQIHRIAKEIEADVSEKKPLFLVMLNGAFMFAAELFKNLSMPCEMSFVKYKTYAGTESTRNQTCCWGWTRSRSAAETSSSLKTSSTPASP